MRTGVKQTLSFLLFSFLLNTALADFQLDSIKSISKGCDKEPKKYCKDITLGKGKVVACLYANEDKISGKCGYTLYDAVSQLQHFISKLNYVAHECNSDMAKFCKNTKPRKGRLVGCLFDNSPKLNNRCKVAIEGLGQR